MRPFTAMGDVHLRTLVQVSAPPLKMTAPVSPSTPISLLPLMIQTMALLVPSVVVAIGAAGPPVIAAHQSAAAVGGDPGVSPTPITTWPPPPLGHWAPVSVEKVTRVP